MFQAQKNAILIAGPTASGKTSLAIKLAVKHDGLIINTDSMQVYGVLNRLTARPDAEELAAAPHHLFGHIDPRQHYSVGKWLDEVKNLLLTELRDRVPVFVGGTGLYFRALLGGLSEMPEISDDIRHGLRMRMEREGTQELYDELSRRDEDGAAAIRPQDGQRILRALEVLEASGKPISYWQKQPGHSLVDHASARKIILEPQRNWLHDRIAERFTRMMEKGAVEEVQALLSCGISADMPVMKAIGVREISLMLNGECCREETINRSIIASRQYAKRQMTWFRNQMGEDWQRLNPVDSV